MKRIVYIGSKPTKADNVAKTGLVWKRGEVLEVADDKMAALLLDHPHVWADADTDYSLESEIKLAPTPPEPRAMIFPDKPDEVSAFWDPITIPVPAEVFTKLQSKELVAVFMTEADADALLQYKSSQASGETKAPVDAKPAKNTLHVKK